MPVRPPTSCARPWCTPIVAFSSDRPASAAPASSIGPRVDIVGVVDDRRQRACEAADPRERDRFGLGRAVRGVHDLDAVSERVHPGLGAHRAGVLRVSNGS